MIQYSNLSKCRNALSQRKAVRGCQNGDLGSVEVELEAQERTSCQCHTTLDQNEIARK
jgi:putative IMPACT (imprinted ancient) family translation regulator